MTQIDGKIVGFLPEERLLIEGSSLFEASAKLGQVMKKANRTILDEEWQKVTPEKKNELLTLADKKLAELQLWSEKENFVVKGKNRLQRYLEALRGYCQGSELSLAEGAFLQTEMSASCQTLIVQDDPSGSIRFIHSEEDMGPAFREDSYWYRWVEMALPEIKVSFFAYPGLCAWGPAFGVNTTTGLVQSIDDLYIDAAYYMGPIWSNAMAFMCLDLGRIELVETLVNQISQIDGGIFEEGYAVHLAQTGNRPRLLSVEFAADKVKILEPARVGDRLIVAQSNCPLDAQIERYSQASYPEDRHLWTQKDAELYIEMRERQQRLSKTGIETDWVEKTGQEAVTDGLEILADPRGDMGRIDVEGQWHYYSSGLPSKWMIAHLSAFIGKDEILFQVGKNRPQALSGQEFKLEVTPEYKYARKKIWEEAELELARFNQPRKPIQPAG